MILATERLVLDELVAERDALFMFELLNEPGFLDNIGDRGVTDLDGARAYIERAAVASYARNGFGLWRVVEAAGGRPVGICGLVRREGLDVPDIGYALLACAEGRGYATEAARATLAYARGTLGLTRIAAITGPDNKASIRVLEKIGLRFEKMLRVAGGDEASCYFTT